MVILKIRRYEVRILSPVRHVLRDRGCLECTPVNFTHVVNTNEVVVMQASLVCSTLFRDFFHALKIVAF